VVRGGSRGNELELDYLPLQADVRPGDRVLTAGIDGVYPRGIPIGTIVSVKPGGQLFHRIQVAPAVDFGTLDQVYLLDYQTVPETLKEARSGGKP
jgi:rod shape-determining protein MreC